MAEAEAIGQPQGKAVTHTDGHGLASDGLGRGLLFLAVYMFFWITVDPFEDLTTEASGDPRIGANLISQILIVMLTAATLVLVRRTPLTVLRAMVAPVLLMLIGWIWLSALTAVYPDLALRRAIQAMMIIVLAACTLLLPQSGRQFNVWLAVAAVTVLVVSYLGVILIPHRAIHQITEVSEPQHAGSWRGPYMHKNITGGAMGLLALIGIHVSRALHRGLGIVIALAAALFLAMSQAKTSIGLFPVALLLTALILWLRSTAWRMVLVTGLLGGFNVLAVGSSVVPQLFQLVSMVTSDPTFTNRADVWRLVITETMARPLTGFGFQAFWGTDALFHRNSVEGWANKASHAHNAFLDIAVTIGIPGAVLAIVWLVLLPILDLRRSERRGGSRTLDGLYIGIWSFTLLCATLEATLFIGAGGGPMWFMMAMAVFGMRLQARTHLVSEPDGGAVPLSTQLLSRSNADHEGLQPTSIR